MSKSNDKKPNDNVFVQPDGNIVVTVGDDRPTCGLVMPISSMNEYSSEHWADVQGIITDVANEAGFNTRIVSDADDSGIIQARIVQNLYSNDIVICDVSGKNANVMFELGMRLAFDKATIVIKDDQTNYSFDTSVIEHLTYPRDLRFNKVITFKKALANKIHATYKASKEDDYSTFLKHFGTFKVHQLQSKDVDITEFVTSGFEAISTQIAGLRAQITPPVRENYVLKKTNFNINSPENMDQYLRHVVDSFYNENDADYKDMKTNSAKYVSFCTAISAYIKDQGLPRPALASIQRIVKEKIGQ